MASTWEIRNLSISGQCIDTQINNSKAEENSTIRVSNGRISIESKTAAPVVIYDFTGRILYTSADTQYTEFNATQKGIYLVRCGNKVTKVVVGRE